MESVGGALCMYSVYFRAFTCTQVLCMCGYSCCVWVVSLFALETVAIAYPLSDDTVSMYGHTIYIDSIYTLIRPVGTCRE